jgi:hypothetical protein
MAAGNLNFEQYGFGNPDITGLRTLGIRIFVLLFFILELVYFLNIASKAAAPIFVPNGIAVRCEFCLLYFLQPV